MTRARENFDENLARIKYLANKYSSTDLFETEYTYVNETEIEFDGQKVSLYDIPYEFRHYCKDAAGDNGHILYNDFGETIGNANELKCILNHDPTIEMPSWIVMIEIFRFMEIGAIEPEPMAPIAILVNASDEKSAIEIAERPPRR